MKQSESNGSLPDGDRDVHHNNNSGVTKRKEQTCNVVSILHLSGKYIKPTAGDRQLTLANKLSCCVINRTDMVCIKA